MFTHYIGTGTNNIVITSILIEGFMLDQDKIQAIQNNITVAKAALDAAQNLLVQLVNVPKPLFTATAKIALSVRDRNGNPINKILQIGESFSIYQENVNAGTYVGRATIDTNGLNVWMGNPLGSAYDKRPA